MQSADTQQYLETIHRTKSFKKHLAAFLPILSLLVILAVFWSLKLTGITLAGEAFCGKEEHTHTEACYESGGECATEEHTHIPSCYSDITADVETAEEWEATLPDLPPDAQTADKIMAIANAQLGYTESQQNFVVDAAEVRRGYTRYGGWYGNPYGDWSTMFTAFCLRYAGLDDVPVSAGADAMALQWADIERYQPSAAYSPLPGDIVFLDKNADTAADATAIITETNDGMITVIEGDLNDQVAYTTYALQDEIVVGYGLTSPGNSLLLMDAAPQAQRVIATTTGYDQSLFTDTNSFVVYTTSGNKYYAFDGNGDAVQIYIDADGGITADVEDANLLLWTFTSSGGTDSYLIQNIGTQKYMHAYPNNGTGVITGGAYPSVLIKAGNGVRIRSNTEYAMLNAADGVFQMTKTQSQAAVYSFGMVSRCTVWLDGTNGGLMSLGGSLNKSYTVEQQSTIKLPEEWPSPTKYSYRLQGWYDVKNNAYYLPGAEITVTGNSVLYADWVADTYDVGQYNSDVVDTVSTEDFITTSVFDYNALFNLLSETVSTSVNSSGHTETWQLITDGTVPHSGNESLNFIFSDYDQYGVDITYPSGNNDRNKSGDIYSGLYTPTLGEILFDTGNSFDPATGKGIIGKQYLGTADHLFQLENDPDSENYGYYYYDSRLNAASYNQSDRRFYVYDYLERTADSEKDGGLGEYSDFLPFNSPYANTGGNTVTTYTYQGENGEYDGTTHYQYDAKYNTESNSTDHIGTNYLFGMSIDIEFYLPDEPGTVNADGYSGNRDTHGQEMHFRFSGDDDVWVFVDGELVLDIGGVHGVESGDINFSTGAVTINGEQASTLRNVSSGEHVLTIYYLERGSSQSNCAIYFNLTPRFELNIQKEDVLTRALLDGAEFSVYTDRACTLPAELWTSEAAYEQNEAATNVFTVENGTATMWGLSAGKTYYIRETKPPDQADYSCAKGIISLSLDHIGDAAYDVEIIPETDQSGTNVPVSDGFSVFGVRIDEESQQAFIVITNAQDWVEETTTVQVIKEWDDGKDHASDAVTAYLTVTDADGTVRRIRETVLSQDNGWRYTWTNLPKYAADGATEIRYGVEEAYTAGYYPTVVPVDQITVSTSVWTQSDGFENGKAYILKTSAGYLSTTSASAATLCWVDEETAKSSPLALWTATVSGGKAKLTNGQGQTLSYNNGNNSNSRYFYATTSATSYQSFTPTASGSAIRLYITRSNRDYYISSLNTSGYLSSTTNSGSGLSFTPMALTTDTTVEAVEDLAFKITNTPLSGETALKVVKIWDVGAGDASLYEQAQISIRLLANGHDTGRTVTLSLKNGWTDTFQGLPLTDANGTEIVYSVQEVWDNKDWTTSYSEVKRTDGETPAYEVNVTNTYRRGGGFQLPSTGGYGQGLWIFSGFMIMLGALVCTWAIRRNRGSP